jgi:hypothetical protein
MIVLFGKRLKQLKDLKMTQGQLITAMIVRYSKDVPSEDEALTTKILTGQKELIEKMFIILGL